MSRPEHLMPPECFYNDKEAKKYTNCSRIIKIQSEMTYRCLDLLGIPDNSDKTSSDPYFIMDIGCGSGLSTEIIEEQGHFGFGLDISQSMLETAKNRDIESELLYSDMGHGFNVKAGFFDAAISVSALQWLCNADKKINHPWKRLITFFKSVQKSLKAGGKAALQFYPENSEQMEMISNAAIKSGLAGGIYVDFPNSSSARKYYLVVSTASEGKMGVIMKDGLNDENELCEKINQRKRKKKIGKNGKFKFKSKFWIYKKKESQRKQGKQVRIDTKYTGRKRKPKFQLIFNQKKNNILLNYFFQLYVNYIIKKAKNIQNKYTGKSTKPFTDSCTNPYIYILAHLQLHKQLITTSDNIISKSKCLFNNIDINATIFIGNKLYPKVHTQ